MFDDYLLKSFVYWTTFSNVKYQDLCATINPSKIKYLQSKTISKVWSGGTNWAPTRQWTFVKKKEYVGARIKIMWEELLLDPPINYIMWKEQLVNHPIDFLTSVKVP